jgi:hypothetical protein
LVAVVVVVDRVEQPTWQELAVKWAGTGRFERRADPPHSQ